MSTPKIDKRDRTAVLAQLEELALTQVHDLTGDNIADWRARKDPAYALMQIFSYMADHTITQLNKVPEKKLIAYLNLIGTNLLCARPARTPINFILSQGAIESVKIPAGTQVATVAKNGLPAVVFETERPITATVAQLKALVSVDPTVDKVFDHLDELNSNRKVTILFTSPELQEHALYLGDDALFCLQKGVGIGYVNIELMVDSDVSLNSKVKWSYCFQDTGDEEKDWIDFTAVTPSSVSDGTELITITKKTTTPTGKKTINGKSTFWIRAQMGAQIGKSTGKLPTVKSIKATIDNQTPPDLAFYNDIPIDLTSSFYPFGSQPSIGDVFYIGSREGFSKKGSVVTIIFGLLHPGSATSSVGGPLLLSWEYWDGQGWNNLKDSSIEPAKSGFQNQISFICPNIMPVKVNSKENYWVRVRIASGNYGINVPAITVTQNKESTQFTTSGISMTAPQISSVQIKNKYTTPIDLQYTITKNNLQFNDLKDQLKPFVPLEEDNQALYLGFDKPLGEGIISVFFALKKQEYIDDKKPRIAWSYLRMSPKKEWVSIQVDDSSNNLTQSGAVEFLAPSEIGLEEKFGRSLYWIRGEVVENPFQSIGQTIANYITAKASAMAANHDLKGIKSLPTVLTPLKINKTLMKMIDVHFAVNLLTSTFTEPPVLNGQPCNVLDIYHPKFSVPNMVKNTPAAPIAYEISLNTTWAVQAETISDEIVGTSEGTLNQPFFLSRTPVTSENVWVKEPNLPTNKDTIVNKTTTGEIWVNWKAANDFFNSDQNSRNYIADRVSGQIKFGNGVNGMIPPVGAVIKATYQTGGGTSGNVALGEVKNLVTAIASIDKAINIDSAQGGSNTEALNRVKERGPKLVQHRMRAVAKEDYEWLSIEASGDVARAKCIPNFNSEGKQESGCVAVIIIPTSTLEKPLPSDRLIQIVEDYLKSHCPLSLVSLTVTGPTYLGVSVTASIYVTSSDLVSSVQFIAMDKIKAFLHPLYGGSDAKGWDFGQIPCNSDILAILQRIPGVVHVENLIATILAENGDTFNSDGSLILPGYTLIYSDAHKFNVEITEAD